MALRRRGSVHTAHVERRGRGERLAGGRRAAGAPLWCRLPEKGAKIWIGLDRENDALRRTCPKEKFAGRQRSHAAPMLGYNTFWVKRVRYAKISLAELS